MSRAASDACRSLVWVTLDTKVRECSELVLPDWYSQHGSTMWPEGASSS